jgi:multidrug efflux pump
MSPKTFIERPILATVIALVIALAGIISATQLPVEQYPPITPVQIQVTANYPGADAQTLSESVAAPMEKEIMGIDNFIYMSSVSAGSGRMILNVYFRLGTNPDIAQVQVQNRIALAEPNLPQIVVQNGISVQKVSSSILMLVSVFGENDNVTPESVDLFAQLRVLDAIKRIPGAGEANFIGMPDQAIRIWLDPDRMAALGITTSDISTAISKQNALFSAGQIGAEPNSRLIPLTIPMVTQSPATKPEQYENIIIRAESDNTAIVRLKDVAKADVGYRQYISRGKLNGKPASIISIYLQAGANGLKVSDGVRKALEDLKPAFPEGVNYKIALDTTEFVRISIDEVIQTLIEAIILVVGVVYLFLQNGRATVICTTAIFVALLGTFAGMAALGFSINLVTLFSMVLLIGLVVDDAIVVVENVERIMHEKHLPVKEATLQAMNEISGALISIVLVISAVFLPAAFLPGSTGQIYKQFAVTMIVAMCLSGIVALTLTPAMCAVLLKPQPIKTTGFFGKFNKMVDLSVERYGEWIRVVMRRSTLAFGILGILFLSIFGFAKSIPSAFVPIEDLGYLMGAIITPDGASLERTASVSQTADEMTASLPAVQDRVEVAGYSLIDVAFKNNTGSFFINFKPFEERKGEKELTSNATMAAMRAKFRSIKDGLVFPFNPPPIPGMGTTGGFTFWIQDTQSGSPAKLDEALQTFLTAARKREELTGLSTAFRAASQQLKISVDRDKAVLLGVSIADVYEAIQAQFASIIVSQYFEYSRVWNVVIQASPEKRANPEDIKRLYIRNRSGQLVPLAALVDAKFVTGPDLVPRFNGLPAAQIQGEAAPGYSSGQGIATMEAVAKEVLPKGYTFAWSGIAYEEKQSGGTSSIAFAMGMVIVFLILAAQFESWSMPTTILGAVPFGLIGALAACWLRGLQNDVYFQVGLLVLIGLAAKNAVLIVEFAVQLRSEGLSITEAAVQAGKLRLRPIVMTSLAFGLGCLPLAIATGAGAGSRNSIGTGIIGGVIGATTLALLYIPLFFKTFLSWTQGKEDPTPPPVDPNPPEHVGGH